MAGWRRSFGVRAAVGKWGFDRCPSGGSVGTDKEVKFRLMHTNLFASKY